MSAILTLTFRQFNMSKITLSAVLAIVSLILKSLRYIINLIDVISDLLDDGVINNSKESSKFSEFRSKVSSILDDFTNYTSDFIDNGNS